MKKILLTSAFILSSLLLISNGGKDSKNKYEDIKDGIKNIHYPKHIINHRDLEKVYVSYTINDQGRLVVKNIASTHKDFEQYVFDNLDGMGFISPTKKDGVLVIKFLYQK
jgi:hypothetical protein